MRATAFHAVQLALAGVMSLVPVASAEPLKPEQTSALRKTLEHLTAARELLAATISDCNGGRILVRACPVRPPADACDPVAPCSIVEAFRQTEAAVAATKSALR